MEMEKKMEKAENFRKATLICPESKFELSLVVSMEAFSKIEMAAVGNFEYSKIIVQICVIIHVE